MNPPSEPSRSGPQATKASWPAIALLGLLLSGLCLAAWQSVHRHPESTIRRLTILAPEPATLTLSGESSRIPVAEGVHVCSVSPGPMALEVQADSGRALSRTLNIPAGYGPLLIELTEGPDGHLLIGYF
jgi:hypothetical protein